MDNEAVVDAIYDLAKVMIAIDGKFESKSQAVRRLNEFGIPPSRIARMISMKLNDVTSILARERKKSAKENRNGEVAGDRV